MNAVTTLEEFEAEYRAGLGTPMPPRAWREVTHEWLGRHSEGAGDYNPLYRFGVHADESRFHAPVAAPSFVFSVDFGANASIWGHLHPDQVQMKDLSILYIGASLEWFAPVYLGDKVRSIETPVGVQPRTTRQLGEALVCSGRTDYYTHRGEKFASLTNQMLRFVNPGRGVQSVPVDEDKPRVAPDPLVHQRTRRGGEVMHVEDVTVGEELPELPKGTFTTTELYLFSHGTLTLGRSPKVDPETIDMGAGGRADSEYARRNRAQAASFDYGPQRITWMTQIVTDWMGDWGDLTSFSSRLLRPNLVGDTNVVRGRITAVHDGDRAGLVEVEVEVVNHADVVTATATATVRLPRRSAGEPRDVPMLWAPATERAAAIYG